MAEPVRKISRQSAPEGTSTWWEHFDHELLEDEDEGPGITLWRWVERPDGELEQMAMPLTPELFLHSKLGDQMGQGLPHSRAARKIADLLEHHFRKEPDVLVTFDLVHHLGPGLPSPSPDVSVIRGVPDPEADRESFDVEEEGNRPCLVVEVISPRSSRIRRTDLIAKVEVYALAGISEYVILDSTRRERRRHLLGYRLERPGRYRSIEPDSQGRILSETTGLWFQISPDGRDVLLSEYPSGRRLLTRNEETELREAAEERARASEEKARTEAEARRALEDEVARLRAEMSRLRNGS